MRILPTILLLLSIASFVHAEVIYDAPVSFDGLKIKGHCLYDDPMERTDYQLCKEYRTGVESDTSWNYYSMSIDCWQKHNGTFSKQFSCINYLPYGKSLAGYCVNQVTETRFETYILMMTETADCATNKIICEDFISGSFDPWLSDAGCQPYATLLDTNYTTEGTNDNESAVPPKTLATDNEGVSGNGNSNSDYDETAVAPTGCLEYLTSPQAIGCPKSSNINLKYGDVRIRCGDDVTLEQASTPPTLTVRPDRIDPDSFYSLLLVDSTKNNNQKLSTAAYARYPILHFGAVNIPGSSLREEFSLSNGGEADVFSAYRGPDPPAPTDPWAPPDVDRTLFVYEVVLQHQEEGKLDVVPTIESNTNFDFEAFLGYYRDESSASKLDEHVVASTSFRSGWCLGGHGGAFEYPAIPRDILIESFDDPKLEWKWDAASGTNNGENSDSDLSQSSAQSGKYQVSMQIVDGVMILSSNTSSSAVNMELNSNSTLDSYSIENFDGDEGEDEDDEISIRPNMFSVNARGLFPDLSKCDGLKIIVKKTPIQENDNYHSYKIGFGSKQREDGHFDFVYGADLAVPSSSTVRSADNSGFTEIGIPFDDFTLDWDFNAGKQHSSCSDNATNCPDELTLQNMKSLTITAGWMEGYSELHIKSIAGTGCDSSGDSNVVQSSWTCSTWNGSEPPASDEIIIESFSDPSFNWMSMNDPILGGESYSSISIKGGAAVFSGEVKFAPVLGEPGFVRMETRGGTYPDVSCCNSLKLTVMATEAYEGYRVSFGDKWAYKADFDAPVGAYRDVVIPFNEFSVQWYEQTGVKLVTCTEDPTFCLEILENMGSLAVWGEGVGGTVDLRVELISAVGCSPTLQNNNSAASDIYADDVSSVSRRSGLHVTIMLPTVMLAVARLSYLLF